MTFIQDDVDPLQLFDEIMTENDAMLMTSRDSADDVTPMESNPSQLDAPATPSQTHQSKVRIRSTVQLCNTGIWIIFKLFCFLGHDSWATWTYKQKQTVGNGTTSKETR